MNVETIAFVAVTASVPFGITIIVFGCRLSTSVVIVNRQKACVTHTNYLGMPSIDYRGGVYDGEVLNGVPHGKGVLTYSSQHVYDGEWTEGRSHGKGSVHGSIASKGTFSYEGTFLDDMMAGRGKFTWPNGDVYDGDWYRDTPNGTGCYIFKVSGARYVGQMKEGKRHGYGTHVFKDGTKFEGEWRHDTRTGKGVELFGNSNKYEGYWLRNQKHGPGL
jgi:hypothetical protein